MKYTAAHWGTYKIIKDKGKRFKLFPFEQDKDPSDIGRGIETALTAAHVFVNQLLEGVG